MDPLGKFLTHTPEGLSLANTAVLASLLDRLLMQGTLQPLEVIDILDNARRQLSADCDRGPIADAMAIVSELRADYQDITQIS
jgi:hypothetical protein